MPDLQSQVIETVIGLAFVYFLLSILVSGLTEAVAWLVGRRAANLKNGLRQLLASNARRDEILRHPLIKRLGKQPVFERLDWLPFRRERLAPSYIPARTFALALVDTLAPPNGGAGGESGEELIARVRKAADGLPGDLKRQLLPLIDAAGDSRDRIYSSIETWYDEMMERVSGWYKRWAFLVTLVFALIVTVAINADSARIAERLWEDDTVRVSVVTAASETAATEPAAEAPLDTGEAAAEAVQELDELAIPIGWAGANSVDVTTLLGWLVTFAAIALGSPFWFGALNRITRLRAAGAKPEATNGSSASS